MKASFLELEAAVRKEAERFGLHALLQRGNTPPDSRIGFAGPGWSGKSTLVRCLLGSAADSAVDRFEHHARTTVPCEWRLGSELAVSVRRTRDSSWLPIPVAGARLNVSSVLRDVSVSFDSARIDLPQEAWGGWSAQFIDIPPVGVTADLDTMATRALSTCDAAVWVMHPRGLGDAEIAVLKRTQGIPVVFLSNVRDQDLTATSVSLAVTPVPVPEAPFSSQFHVIGLNSLEAGEERALLIGMLGLLRHAHLAQRYTKAVRNLADTIGDLQAGIASSYESRFAQLRKRIVDSDAIGRLDVIRGLQCMGRQSDLELLPALERLGRLRRSCDAHQANSIEQDLGGLVECASRVARRYNIVAGAKVSPSDCVRDTVAPSGFGHEFLKPRQELLAFLRNAAANAEAMMLSAADVKSIQGLAGEIQDGRIEIALLGGFSSGKSALANSLLDVSINDRESELLPTRPTVTTATVNRLEWAERKQLNGVEWLDETELTFLEAQEVGIRVREAEIKAFRAWLASGAVSLRDCEIIEFEEGQRSKIDKRRLVERLFNTTIGPDDRCHTYLQEPPAGRVAARVAIRRFMGNRPPLVPGMPLKDAFLLAEEPHVSLQVGTLRIGYPHELLRFGAIVDTPGTDSHIPHHRTMSRSVVKRKRVPVIYCCLSTQPSGIEDRRNIEILLDGGRETMRRVFFVITRKGDISEPQREELRSHVKERLDAFQAPCQSLHFIELVAFKDHEFRHFREQLTAFIKAEQRPQLSAWAQRSSEIFRHAHAAAVQRIEDLELAEEQRLAKEAACKARMAALELIVRGAKDSEMWGAPYVRRRAQEAVREKCDSISLSVAGLASREDFGGYSTVLEGMVDELNAAASRSATKALEAMRGKVHSMLAELKERAPSRHDVGDDAWFDASSAVTQARDVTFSRWEALSDWFSYTPQIERARNSILGKWTTARKVGEQACEKAIERGVSHYVNEVSRLVDAVRVDLAALRLVDPAERERLRKRLMSAKESAGAWVKRLADWKTVYDDESGES